MSTDSAVMYGIPNCDTCRKARRWLDAQQTDYRFHDVRADALSAKTLRRWCGLVGWENLLNRRSTTWRQLDAADRDDVNQTRAVALMHAHPTLMKRPVIELNGAIVVGFNEARYTALLTV